MIRLEEFDYDGAVAIALAMLAISFLMLLAINLIQVWSRRRYRRCLTTPAPGSTAPCASSFARIARERRRAAPDPRPAVWATGTPRDRPARPRPRRRRPAGPTPTPPTARSTGSGQAALDAALAVIEAEVARLRGTVLAYGEALKEIEVYGRDATVARAPPPRRCAGRRSGCRRRGRCRTSTAAPAHG